MRDRKSTTLIYLLTILVSLIIFPLRTAAVAPAGELITPPPGNSIMKIDFPQLAINAGYLGCRLNARGRAVPRLVRPNRSVALRKRLRDRAQRARVNGASPHRIAKIRQTVRKRLQIPAHRSFCEAALKQPKNFLAPLPEVALPPSPDSTKTLCEVADFNNDGSVDKEDLFFLLKEWGKAGTSADLNGDGYIGAEDLLILLALWGPVNNCSPWNNAHSFTGLPMTMDGWTDLVALYQHEDYYTDSRIIYVSSSEGDDSEAKYYKAGASKIGDNPFMPQGAVAPYASLASAYSQVRDGYPDIILLKRGDIWDEDFPTWRKSGHSTFQPAIIASYGNVSEERPAVNRFRTRYGVNHPEDHFSNLLIAGIEFKRGLQRLIGGNNWLIEDCLSLDGRNTGMAIQGLGPEPLNRVAIRRSVIAGRYREEGTGHVQGMFITGVNDLLIEENVLDKNGHNQDGSGATIFNHNAYLTTSNKGVIFRSNISARAASHGVHQRSGGIMENNLFLQNPLVQFGYSHSGSQNYGPFGGVVRGNVILDSRDISNSVRGFGLRLEALKNASIHDNIIAHQRTGNGNIMGISYGHFSDYLQHAENVSIFNNKIYRWAKNGSGRALRINAPDNGELLNFSISDNWFDQHDGDLLTLPSANLSEIEVRDNQYFSSKQTPFSPGDTFAGWQSFTEDEGSFFGPAGFPDPERDIESYMASIGNPQPGYQDSLEAFLLEARKQRRGNWRDDYTTGAVVDYIRGGFNSQ